MKKIILALFALVLASNASAQLVQFGVTGDLAFIKEDSEKLTLGSAQDALTPDMGWSAGLKLKVSTPFGLGADLAVKYAEEDRAYTFFNGSSTAVDVVSDKVAFVSVPVNVRFDFKLPLISNVLVPFAYAGPQFNYNFDDFDWKSKTVGGQDLKDYVKENAINWNINFGFGAVVAKHIEVFYNYSITKSDSYEFKNIKEGMSLYNDMKSRYQEKTNRVGVTLYF